MPTVMPMGPIPPPVDREDMLLVVCWFCWLLPDIVKLGMDVMGLEMFEAETSNYFLFAYNSLISSTGRRGSKIIIIR